MEDEPAIAESVAYALQRDGFAVVAVTTAAEADAEGRHSDLVILDLMLPDGSGFDLIGRWRHQGLQIPIIVLSSRESEADRVAALETGADDYVTKPFSPREVVARVRAILRRMTSTPHGPSFTNGSVLAADEATRRATVGRQPLELTRVEFDLLARLLENPGRVYTRAQLIDSVWGDGFAISDRTVDSHVKAVRRKVAEAGGDPALIETVRGVGYRIGQGSPAGGTEKS